MLFKSTAELQNYIELNSHVNFASLQSSIRTAEKELLVPIIGLSFYLDLDAKYNATPASTLSTAETALVNVIQAALAPYSMVLYIPKSEVNITDGGIRRNETETAKTAYQYQVTNLKKSFQEDTDKSVEYLLAYLELKRDDFPVWTASQEFKRYRSLFIKTGGEFNEYYSTASPYRNYIAMRYIMNIVEQSVIKANMGDAFFAAIKAKEEDVSPIYSAEEKELLTRTKRAISHLTISEAVNQLAVRIDGSGLSIVSSGGSSRDDDSKRAGATDNHLSALQRSAASSGQYWLTEMINYLKLKASPTVFPEFYAWQQSLTTTITTEQPCEGGLYGMF